MEERARGRRFRKLWQSEGGAPRWIAFILSLIVLVAIVAVLVGSFRGIPAGHKGVVINGPGGPDRTEIDEGWHFNPSFLVSQIEIIRYNVQTRDMIGPDGLSLTVRSADNLNIQMDVSLVYHFPGERVADIRIDYGIPIELIDRYMRNVPRNVASNFTGEYIGGIGRVVVEDEIQRQITVELARYDIVVDDLLLRSVDLPTTVDQAIEEKLAAEQKLVTAELERQATIIRAMAEADRLRLEAEGIRNATVIVANGTAESIRLVINQLRISDPDLTNATWAYLTQLYIQALTDPNSNVSFVVISDGSVPIIIQPKP